MPQRVFGIDRAPGELLSRRKLAGVAVMLLVLGVGVAAAPAPAAAQCAMCRSAFDSPEGREMIRRYQAGIAMLLVVPFAAFGTVAYFAVKGRREIEDDGDNN